MFCFRPPDKTVNRVEAGWMEERICRKQRRMKYAIMMQFNEIFKRLTSIEISKLEERAKPSSCWAVNSLLCIVSAVLAARDVSSWENRVYQIRYPIISQYSTLFICEILSRGLHLDFVKLFVLPVNRGINYFYFHVRILRKVSYT